MPMSRITGIVSSNGLDYRGQYLERMVSNLSSSKTWTSRQLESGNAALAWCGWSTPNIAADSGIMVVFDGTIYNHVGLGSADSAAALFIVLYQKHGFDGALLHINGDFAVALYDAADDTLWLARDRFGVKPLYYVSNTGSFAFASRPRALLGLPGVNSEVSRQYVALFAASHYRTFDTRPDESPYAGIAQLPAARLLRVRNGQVDKSVYWSLQDLPDFTESEDVLAESYRELLIDAVSLRFKASQRPAFTLSGGMDSSSVLASAVHSSGHRQHAFSTVYTDKTYDESDDIRTILDEAVAEWHPIQVDNPDVFELVRRMIAVHDEPIATATWLSHFLLCEEVSTQGFGALFGGLGGDELNAGEYEYFFFFFADLRAAGQEERLAREVERWVHYHDHPIFRKSPHVVQESLDRLVDFSQPGRCLPDRQRLERYAAALNPDYFKLQSFEPAMDHLFLSFLKNRTYQDIYRETIPCCLRAQDRHGAAFGLENFVPFFDHRLVEFMFRVAGTLKYRDGVTKHLLRQAMRGVLPEATRTRVKKTGWNAPAHLWFSGSGRQAILDLVASRSFRQRGIYNMPEVERLVAEHEEIISSGAPRENHMMFLWQLVNLELWLQAVDRLDAS